MANKGSHINMYVAHGIPYSGFYCGYKRLVIIKQQHRFS